MVEEFSNKQRIVFMGSDVFSLPILQKLITGYPVVGVVTQPDKPAGRGKKLTPSAVTKFATRHNLPVAQPKKLSEPGFLVAMKEWNPEAVVVAAYGKILPLDILSFPDYGCINVHASLLPRWRGASPIRTAILNGDPETGVTIMLMDEGIDTGDVLAKRRVEIEDSDTYGTLIHKLSEMGAELLIETLPLYFNRQLDPEPQANEIATYTSMIKKSDAELDFSKPADYLERKIRAFNPDPVCFMKWDDSTLRVYKSEVSKNSMLEQGQRGKINKFPGVGTPGKDLILLEVQPEGKRIMSGKAFLNGARNWIE